MFEDDQAIAEMHAHMLQMVGFSTKILPEAGGALEIIQDLRPALILLDVRLEREGAGVDLLHDIRNHELAKESLVIVITGYPSLIDRVEADADLVLVKPVDLRLLGIMVLRLYSDRHGPLHEMGNPMFAGLILQSELMWRLEHNLKRVRDFSEHRFALLVLKLKSNTAGRKEFSGRVQHQVAQRLLRRLRLADTCARLGDSEYAIVLDGIREPANVSAVAARLKKAVQAPFDIAEKEIRLEADLGVAVGSPEYHDAEAVLIDARQALASNLSGRAN